MADMDTYNDESRGGQYEGTYNTKTQREDTRYGFGHHDYSEPAATSFKHHYGRYLGCTRFGTLTDNVPNRRARLPASARPLSLTHRRP